MNINLTTSSSSSSQVSPTTRSRSPTLSNSESGHDFNPTNASPTSVPTELMALGKEGYREDSTRIKSPHIVTIPSPLSTHTMPPLRRTFFSLKPRPYPTFFFFVVTFLLFSFAPSNTGSVFLQSLLNMAAPLLFVYLKQIWVPNPKDELLPATITAYFRKFGFIAGLWYFISLFTYLHLNNTGPVSFVCTQVALPVLILFLSKRLIHFYDIHWDQSLTICLAALTTGLLLIAGALLYTSFHWTFILALVTVGLQSLNLVWLEKYMAEVDTDPWVFCGNIAPAATLLAAIFWLVFDRTIKDAYGILLRNALLYGIHLLATTFLLHHLSAFTLSMLLKFSDLLFLLIFWQLQSLHMRWFGYLGFLCFGLVVKFLPKPQDPEYTAVQNPI